MSIVQYNIIKDKLKHFPNLIRLVRGGKTPYEKFKNIDINKDNVIYDYIKGIHDIGILLRDDYVVLDIDPRNGGSTNLSNFDLLSIETMIQKTPSNGYHIFFKNDKNPKTLIKFNGIDILYGWKYVKYYGDFVKDVDICPLSILPSMFFNSKKVDKKETKNIAKLKDLELDAVLNLVNVEVFRKDNEGWIAFVSSFLTLYDDINKGHSALVQWSSQDLTYDYNDIAKRIYSLTGSNTGYSTAVTILNKKGQKEAYKLLLEYLTTDNDFINEIKNLEDNIAKYHIKITDTFEEKVEKIYITRQLKLSARANAIIRAIKEDAGTVKQHHYLTKYSLEYLIYMDFGVHYDLKLQIHLVYNENNNIYEYANKEIMEASIEDYMFKREALSNHLTNGELKSVFDSVDRLLNDDRLDFLEDTPYLGFNNYTLYINLKDQTVDLLKPNKMFLTHLHIPNSININDNKTPVFDDLIYKKIFKSDNFTYQQQCYDFIIDFFAHFLLHFKLTPRIFLFFGQGHNGKTLIAELLREILGHRNCLFTQIHRILDGSNNHASETLVGKLAIIDDDFDTQFPLNTSKLKSLSESKYYDVNPKNKKNFESRSMFAPIILTNTEPQVKDISEGFSRRLIYVKFENNLTDAFEEGYRVVEDIKKRGEIDKILYKIYLRLQDVLRGNIRVPKKFEEDKKEFLARSNPFLAFLHQAIVETEREEDSVQVNDLYKVYIAMKRTLNYKVMAYDSFLRILVSSGLKIKRNEIIGALMSPVASSCLIEDVKV